MHQSARSIFVRWYCFKKYFFARHAGNFLMRRTQFRPTRAVAECVSKGLVFPLQIYWNIDAKSGSSENQFSAPTWIYLSRNSPPPWTLRPCSKRAVSFSIKAAEQRNCLSPTLFPRGWLKIATLLPRVPLDFEAVCNDARPEYSASTPSSASGAPLLLEALGRAHVNLWRGNRWSDWVDEVLGANFDCHLREGNFWPLARRASAVPRIGKMVSPRGNQKKFHSTLDIALYDRRCGKLDLCTVRWPTQAGDLMKVSKTVLREI